MLAHLPISTKGLLTKRIAASGKKNEAEKTGACASHALEYPRPRQPKMPPARAIQAKQERLQNRYAEYRNLYSSFQQEIQPILFLFFEESLKAF